MGTAADYHLLVMRHAKSDWGAGNDVDFDRPLTGRGEKQAGKMGKWLRGQGLVPDAVVSSPAHRARDTALIVCGELGIDPAGIVWETDLYEASLGGLIEVIDKHSPGRARMLLIGHNPGLDGLVRHLAEQFAIPPRYADHRKMLEMDDIDWSRITAFHLDEYVGISATHPAS
mgnify:CR=1 FL=1